MLRKNKTLNSLNEGRGSNENKNTLVAQLDEDTEAAARYVATTYDRLGFILKYDRELEDEILRWHGYVIADMWMLTRDLIMEKWRKRSKSYLMEFERLAEKAVDYDKSHVELNSG